LVESERVVRAADSEQWNESVLIRHAATMLVPTNL
jgi:hypothetical protein